MERRVWVRDRVEGKVWLLRERKRGGRKWKREMRRSKANGEGKKRGGEGEQGEKKLDEMRKEERRRRERRRRIEE